MAQMKTPGVYLKEKDAFPNSVVEVSTAVPAFIGYTEKAENGTQPLLNKPFRISSFAEFQKYFGGSADITFSLKAGTAAKPAVAEETDNDGNVTKPGVPADPGFNIILNNTKFKLDRSSPVFRLFDAIRFFYQNGGGPCYIVSVGDYSGLISKGLLDGTDVDNPGGGLITLKKEQEPTMVLVPDALSLDSADKCYSVYEQVIAHCEKMMSRVAILDVYDGYKDQKDPSGDVIEAFRKGVGANGLKYAIGYYPWVETTIVQETELSFTNLDDDSIKVLTQLFLAEQGITKDGKPANPTGPDKDFGSTEANAKAKQKFDFLNAVSNFKPDTADDINKSLIFLSPVYNGLLKEIQNRLNILPPASAMAGVYTKVDATRGVWKAPANVSLNSVVKPSVNITFEDQEDLNISLTGKSINAIRSFIGEGVLVWGARTLDGNSQDWRYINVRRTMIMLEQSVKAAAKAYVFEPNDSGTWTTVKSMIENFLSQQWKRGALAGATPEDAYSVHVGLGATMTANDILDGIMRITVLIAVSRPAEFIEINFQQQLQKS